jgi:hypothetical protein
MMLIRILLIFKVIKTATTGLLTLQGSIFEQTRIRMDPHYYGKLDPDPH